MKFLIPIVVMVISVLAIFIKFSSPHFLVDFFFLLLISFLLTTPLLSLILLLLSLLLDFLQNKYFQPQKLMIFRFSKYFLGDMRPAQVNWKASQLNFNELLRNTINICYTAHNVHINYNTFNSNICPNEREIMITCCRAMAITSNWVVLEAFHYLFPKLNAKATRENRFHCITQLNWRRNYINGRMNWKSLCI